MVFNTGVPSGAHQAAVLLVSNMISRRKMAIFLGQAEVNHIYSVLIFGSAYQEIVRLYVPMNKVFLVQVLRSRQLN
jgi:hypothetical protein